MPGLWNSLAKRVAHLRQIPGPARFYVLETMGYLMAVRLTLRVIPFRRLIWLFARPPKRPEETFSRRQKAAALLPAFLVVNQHEITGTEREQFQRSVQWLIDEASQLLPGQTVCFPQAIAGQALLRRLGIGTTLYYGAAVLPGRGLTAHVWLQDGPKVILGQTEGQDYHILAHYPASVTTQTRP